MCFDIFRDTGRAFQAAGKQKKMPKTILALAESAIIFAIAISLFLFKMTGNATILTLLTAVYIFVLVIGVGLIGGYIIKIIANALGAKGSIFEGLTVISYALMPMGTGVLSAIILSLVPMVGGVFGAIALSVLFALGLAVLYRGVKEMFKMDMITSFVTISILTIALIIGIYSMMILNFSLDKILPII